MNIKLEKWLYRKLHYLGADKTIDMNDVEVFLFKIRRHLCTGSMMYAESLESTQKKLELKLLSSAPPANLLLLEYSPNFLLVS